ncbi:DUF6894 family protein [Rhizobium sp. Rhizsp82]|uniref:DUF6894 family protein n=1 Tax=Rhizobium sp. Rhizsp82 TaxID=3243057 RepID=UPI0039B47DBA
MKFYFHVRDIESYDEDVEGTELSSLSAAVEEARQSAREMVAELVLQDALVDGRRFEIADETGDILETVTFKEVVRME